MLEKSLVVSTVPLLLTQNPVMTSGSTSEWRRLTRLLERELTAFAMVIVPYLATVVRKHDQ